MEKNSYPFQLIKNITKFTFPKKLIGQIKKKELNIITLENKGNVFHQHINSIFRYYYSQNTHLVRQGYAVSYIF